MSALHGFGTVINGRFFTTLPVPQADASLSQQTMIVTGANTGLGLEASRHLSRLGVGKIILAVRTVAKGEKAKQDILATTKRLEASIEIWQLDMSNHESIKAFASRASHLERLDAVAANAGIMVSDFVSEAGFESTLNVNFINTFLLYTLLLPTMRQSGRTTGNPCRFSVTNSALHYMAQTKELEGKQPDLMKKLSDPEKANMSDRYNLSKLLVVYAVCGFAAAQTDGLVIVNAPNPSFCRSELGRERQSEVGFKIFTAIMARTTEEGSRTLVHAMLAGLDTNGQYLNDCHISTPAKTVTSEKGQEIQKYVFQELLRTLEAILPGVTTGN